MSGSIFISGTNTGVGKTLVSTLLVAALKQHGKKAGYFKPIQTGLEHDLPVVQAGAGSDIDYLNPVYSFPAPQAPSRAAREVGETVELEKIVCAFGALPKGHWVVEGAGGLLVPLTNDKTVADLIAMLKTKLLIVASAKLGTINHTLLTIESAHARGVEVAGVVLSGDEDPGLEEFFKEWGGPSILARVPWLPEQNPEMIQEMSRRCFPAAVLTKIFGEEV